MENFILFLFITIQPNDLTTINYTLQQEMKTKKECIAMARDIFYYSTPIYRKSDVLILETHCLITEKNSIEIYEEINKP